MKTWIILGAVVAGLVSGAGCKTSEPASPPATAPVGPPPPPPPAEVVIGRIVHLGPGLAFVVVQLDAGQEAQSGEDLSVRFAGVEVGRVRVSPERNNRLITADVTVGTVEKGYEVVRVPKGGAPTSPPP